MIERRGGSPVKELTIKKVEDRLQSPVFRPAWGRSRMAPPGAGGTNRRYVWINRTAAAYGPPMGGGMNCHGRGTAEWFMKGVDVPRGGYLEITGASLRLLP